MTTSSRALDTRPERWIDRVAIIGAIGGSLDAAAPLQRFEHMVRPWVYGILPAFGLFNAGVAIDATVLRSLPTAVPLGIMVGLVLGKSVGIGLASWLAVKTGLAELLEGSTMAARQHRLLAASASPWRCSSAAAGCYRHAFSSAGPTGHPDRIVAGRSGQNRHLLTSKATRAPVSN
ncbi:MAG: Na+/H+ antiporter NhaA [Comamonadaceae bacterium]|nr:Na+/H+ antiporter NhaA [Comamonadaceae bacterium]